MIATTKTSQHVRHVKKMSELICRVNNDLLDINCEGRDHVHDEELKHNLIIDIGLRAFTFYEDAKKASISEARTGLLYANQRASRGKEFRRKCAAGEIQLYEDHHNPHRRQENHNTPNNGNRLMNRQNNQGKMNHTPDATVTPKL